MPRTKELSATEKIDACIEWVENEIAETLEEDPSGFLLGIQSVAVVEALRDVRWCL